MAFQSRRLSDPLIREGFEAAVERTLLPALVERAYPGHFTVTADGSHFGSESTWPGLDSWEMAGAYLLLGMRRPVLDYFAFVRASQRADGNIPFAIFPGNTTPDGWDSYLRGLNWPDDVYAYAPPGAPARQWIGLFHHWQQLANPLSILGSVSYILTADEIAADGAGERWLEENLDSIERAGRYLLTRRAASGLLGGAGFYIECPPRNQFDGTGQCYAIAALRALARMCRAANHEARALAWESHAEALRQAFQRIFWRGDHFAEYVHPERGVVDLRRLTDVTFAAIALDVATDEQCRSLWPRLVAERSFWHGGMPTQLAALPAEYQPWELPEPIPFKHPPGPRYDVAAMGRVWYLDALACRRMKSWQRLRESVRLVCQRGQRDGWQWHERYHAQADKTVRAAGPAGYCEYAAVLVRIVLSNAPVFCSDDLVDERLA